MFNVVRSIDTFPSFWKLVHKLLICDVVMWVCFLIFTNLILYTLCLTQDDGIYNTGRTAHNQGSSGSYQTTAGYNNWSPGDFRSQQVTYLRPAVSRSTSTLYNAYVQIAENPLLLMEDGQVPGTGKSKSFRIKAAEEEYNTLLRDYNISV